MSWTYKEMHPLPYVPYDNMIAMCNMYVYL